MNEQSFESSSNVLEPRVEPQVQERPSAEAPNITSDVPKPAGESQSLDESLWRDTADVGYQAHPTGVIRTGDCYRDAMTRIEELEKAMGFAVLHLTQIKDLANVNKATRDAIIHIGNHLNAILRK